jgi:hypothetical protein
VIDPEEGVLPMALQMPMESLLFTEGRMSMNTLHKRAPEEFTGKWYIY